MARLGENLESVRCGVLTLAWMGSRETQNGMYGDVETIYEGWMDQCGFKKDICEEITYKK